ncbi:uncharacterized protein LOC112590692 [Harpegnathos saltator]|uniref:uncharacterized protein LOC112590692 n=1 Tax=Harpegnathos saltator TaxID=610380 RepID=UPI000DBED188|nr:uncharacterized protein LOC112590692 [Harpegnathos saltator]
MEPRIQLSPPSITPPGSSMICYADDTLILAGGNDWGDALREANIAVACAVRAIRSLDLAVAERKTETIFLYKKKKGMKPPQAQIRMGTVRVPIEAQMKYLGLTLDGTLCFKEHISRLVPRLRAVSANLCKLMPNIRGPDRKARHLHTGILNSVALYGAPVWPEALVASRPLQALLRRAHRAVAVRVIRGYRTVSHVAATVLAGMPPLELLALMYRNIYMRRGELMRTRDASQTLAGVIQRMKHQARQLLLWRRQRPQENTRYGRRTVEAVHPCLQEWVNRGFGTLTFKMTHVLIGHGCFGEYLCRMGKESTAHCHQSDVDHDSAQDFPAWAAERGVVIRELGHDLFLPTIVNAIMGSERKWGIFASFCEAVILQKEAAEETRR